MASTVTTHAVARPTSWLGLDAGRRHRIRLGLAWLLVAGLIVGVAIYGLPYYRLDLAGRVRSPLHSVLRPSGTIGIKLGMLGLSMFLVLFLYPIRKRWRWLGTIGKTKHWLDFHVLLGLTAPVIITLHSSFKLNGLAGVAYWIMMAVALSGIVGRYLYAQIPRSLSMAELSLKEMQAAAQALSAELSRQALFTEEDLSPLVTLPPADRVRDMSLIGVLFRMLALDLRRPFQVSGLRRKCLSPVGTLTTLGGLLRSTHQDLERVIDTVRKQSWVSAKMLFLTRAQAVFHLWHVVHRPFSYSFSVLVAIHIVVVVLLGYF